MLERVPEGAPSDEHEILETNAAEALPRLQALELWRATSDGTPPFGVVFLCDPAEEVGSPGLATALAVKAPRLRADACLWESFLRDEDGRPGIGFGCRGVLEVRLRLRVLRVAQHNAFASFLRSAPLELMRAVTSLIDEHGNLRVPALSDGALAPTPEQRRAADLVPLPVDAVTIPGAGVRPFVCDDEAELRRRLSFAPSLSVARMRVGADGVGTVPDSAVATVGRGAIRRVAMSRLRGVPRR